MKKVKITIIASIVLAVAGGALAFKAKVYSNVCYFSSIHPAFICPAVGLGTTVGGFGFETYATAEVYQDANFIDCTEQGSFDLLPCLFLVPTKPEE